MVVSDTGKVVLQAIVIVGLFALALTGKADTAVVIPAITGIAGVIIGNGGAAVRKHAPSAMLMSNVQPNEVVTIHGSYPMDRTNGDEVDEGTRTSHS
jgi:uncharacterized membrane protein